MILVRQKPGTRSYIQVYQCWIYVYSECEFHRVYLPRVPQCPDCGIVWNSRIARNLRNNREIETTPKQELYGAQRVNLDHIAKHSRLMRSILDLPTSDRNGNQPEQAEC